ncbi:MAG TPA: ATP synthase F0 subunit B [Acidimicrobiaceae bacterium]|nr:ATP synthase F0 subunit B [Acidimicrobiaceae bacterium]HCB37407.1 ATP synthase F0 subunit B [Acidimicrobiaceae bacterium]
MNAALAALWSSAEGAGEAVAEAPNPIIPAWDEVIWGSLAFLILLVVMWKFAYPAIRKAMEGRTARIQAEIDAAAAANREAQELRARYDARLVEADAEAARIVEAARGEAERVRRERLAAIEPEIAERRAQAEADIEAARVRALADVRSQITSLAVGAASQVVMASLDADAHRRLIDDYIDNVGG